MTELTIINGKPATVASIAPIEFEGIKDFSETPKNERQRNTNGLIDQVRIAALVAVEFLVFDKDELIAKASADHEALGSVLMGLADAADSLKALQEIVEAAEMRLCVALANVKPTAA
jgi:hypothetical protein